MKIYLVYLVEMMLQCSNMFVHIPSHVEFSLREKRVAF